eukprot:XP_011675233.1 PREDICTED: protein slit-like [Strongylocentrotus purpuratus]
MAFIRRVPLLRCLSLVVFCILTPTLIQTIHQDAMFTPPMICHYDAEQKKADCYDRGLDSIPQNLPNDIKELDVAFNNITFILSSSFKRYSLIQDLDLSKNDIRMIESASFYPLKDLNRLILYDNPNLVLPATDLFRWSKNLSILDLSFCNLKLLPNDTLKWSQSVESIDLSFNKLTFVNMGLCGRVKNISLAYNKIEHLTTESVIFGCQSGFVDLHGNPIKSVDPNVIASLRARSLELGYSYYPLTLEILKDIFIGVCRSEIVELTINGANFSILQHDVTGLLCNCSLSLLRFTENKLQSLSPYVFSNLTRLVELDLSQNQIVTVEPVFFQARIFEQLSALQNLSLEACHISCIPHLAFTGLESLRVLNLRGNIIQQLNFDIFKMLDQMTIINLDDNLLAYLDEQLFSNNPRLTTLLLSNNRLTSLNQTTFEAIESSLLSLDFSMNPINCNCDLRWLRDWMSGHIDVIDENRTVCSSASLEPLRGKPLLDFDPNTLCGLNIALVCLTPLAGIFLIVVVAVLYHNRWQLKYKLFLLKLMVIGYKEMRDARDHVDYEFDLNIIFYDDDEEWVRQQLQPALEERLPQFERNVIGDQDLILGMHYLDAVDYVVSHRYKTLILLSRAAVHDRWFMLKLRTAMDHVSDTQTEFVVVVFLEDFPDEDIPFLARLYLSDGRPYLHWTEDVRGHDFFWNKLVKNLTINLRTNDLIPNE